MQTDAELLRQYVEEGSEAAFGELVRRYLGLVYSAAARQAGGNAALAEDVTQTVFILLARQAPALVRHETIAGWLHTCTRYTTLRALRDARRRQHRERKAAAMEMNDTPKTSWDEVRPLLDEAVAQLNTADRQAVLLRFFQGRSHREVGAALGVTEDAARVRVDRALDKLRRQFARRGIVTTGALLGETILAHASETQPAGLADSVGKKVTSAATVAMSGWGGWLGPLFFMSTKNKILTVILVVLLAGLLRLSVPWWGRSSVAPKSLLAQGVSAKPPLVQNNKATTVEMPKIAAATAVTAETVAAENIPVTVGTPPPPPPPGVVLGAGARRDGSNAYDNFAIQMKFTAEQEAALLKILNDGEDQVAALRDAVRSKLGDEKFMEIVSKTGKDDSLQDANVISDSWKFAQTFQGLVNQELGIADQVNAIKDATTVKLRQFLGSVDKFKAYQIYNSQAGVRSWVAISYGFALRSAGAPALTPDQQEALVNIVAKSLQPGDSPGRLEHLSQVVDQASAILTPEQIEVLKTNPRGNGLSYDRLHGVP